MINNIYWESFPTNENQIFAFDTSLHIWIINIIKKTLIKNLIPQHNTIRKKRDNCHLKQVSSIFFLPQRLQFDWLNRWRDKDDKLFHPSNLLSGYVIKKKFKNKRWSYPRRAFGLSFKGACLQKIE